MPPLNYRPVGTTARNQLQHRDGGAVYCRIMLLEDVCLVQKNLIMKRRVMVIMPILK